MSAFNRFGLSSPMSVSCGLAPDVRGPLALRYEVNLNAAENAECDLSALENADKLDGVQTVWIDNRRGVNALFLTVGGTLQVIACPAGEAQYFPIATPDACQFILNRLDAGYAQLQFLNVPVAPVTNGSPYTGPTKTFRLLDSAAGVNSNLIKGAPGKLYYIEGQNNAAYAVFLKLYDKATAPIIGTDTPRRTTRLAPGTPFAFALGANGGGPLFYNGIGFGLTKVNTDADTTPVLFSDIQTINFDYA